VTKVLCVCTGNVARSVMLAHMLTTLAEAEGREWRVRTAGTHAVEGASVSARTKAALEAIAELPDLAYGAHRSTQVGAADLAWADAVLCVEAGQVRLLRDRHPEAAAKVVSVGQFVRVAPLDQALAPQVAAVAALEPDPAVDVADPAGGEQDDYDRCAGELWEIAQVFVTLAGD
jgi:protein-tyrosine-phosphatase